ncbi:MAG: Holliday junction resolvase RuvX [Gammaproteobacteria bacterium]|nr:Holliday junction resolvase RuvX [Gammaproteobacteria bacterium]
MTEGIYLGFDFSYRKIGVASGQSLTKSATALTTIKGVDGQPDWTQISTIIDQWNPKALIIGLPLAMDGEEQKMTQAAREFGQALSNRYHLPIYFMDERLSSREASHLLGYDGHTSPRRVNRKGKKVKKQHRQGENIDSKAAELILQSWLNQQAFFKS